MECGIFSRHFGYRENPSRSNVSQKPLRDAILHRNQVSPILSLWDIRRMRVSEGIKSEDAVFVLAYSVIMLNTDLHNPQVRVRRISL